MARKESIFWSVIVILCSLAVNSYAEEVQNVTLPTSFPTIEDDLSCQFSLNASVEASYNESDAVLHVTVNSPPSTCNFSLVELKLLSNRCDSAKFKVHTPKRRVVWYSKNTPTTEKQKICDIDTALRRTADRVESGNATTFKIHHVYSGLYCLRISLVAENGTKLRYSQDMDFTTNETALFPAKWKPQIEIIGLTRWVIPFRFKLVEPKYNFEHFMINLYKVRRSCPNSEKDWKNLHKISNDRACMYLTLKDVTKAKDASFSNLKSGSYCMTVTPIEDRCHPEATYWQENTGITCTRYFPHTIKVKKRSTARMIFEKVFGI